MIPRKVFYIPLLFLLQRLTRVSSSFVSSCISQFTLEYAADHFISQQEITQFLHSYSTDTNETPPSFESLDPFVQIAFARFVCGGNEQCRLDILEGDQELGYAIEHADDADDIPELEHKIQDLCMALYLHGQEFHGESLQALDVDLFFLVGLGDEIKPGFEYKDTLLGISTVLYNVMHWKTFIVRSLHKSGDRYLQAIPPTMEEVVQFTDRQSTSCPDEFTISFGCMLLSTRIQMYADPSRYTLEEVTVKVHSIVKESMDQGNFLQQLNDFEMDANVKNDVKEILYVDPNAVSPTLMPTSIPSSLPSKASSFVPSIAPSFENSFVPTDGASFAPSIQTTTNMNTTFIMSPNTTTTSTTDHDDDGSRGTPNPDTDLSPHDTPQNNNVDPDSIVVIATLGLMLLTLLILFTVKKYQLKKRERLGLGEEVVEADDDVVEVDEEIMEGDFGGEQSESVSSLEVE